MSSVIYPLLVVIVLQQFVFVRFLTQMARDMRSEREHLQNKLIAMADAKASVLINSQEHSEPGDVKYVDEQREWELSASNT